MERLIVISSLVHALAEGEAEAHGGGLPQPIVSAMAGRNALWFGWSGKVTECFTGSLKLECRDGMRMASVDLDAADIDEFVNGYANRTLWPMLHGRTDLAEFERHFTDGYERGNSRLARSIMPLIEEDHLVWVHDYPLFLVANELRALGCANRIGFFLHTPWPHRSILTGLPDHARMVQALLCYDVIGFQTEDYRQAFLDYLESELGISPIEDGLIEFEGRCIRVLALPVGIDAAEYRDLLASPEARASHQASMESANGRSMIAGVDRLDFSKGLPQRFAGYDRFLSARPDMQEQIFLLQIAPPARNDIPCYSHIREELEALSGRINGKHATSNWVPIRYVNREHSRQQLAGIFRAARIGLVTPLQDGMNLVAKEFVAAQDPENPGVLILSKFTGAAAQLKEALTINPFSADELAEAIEQALKMPVAERKRRWRSLYDIVNREDVAWWCDSFLQRLRGSSEIERPVLLSQAA